MSSLIHNVHKTQEYFLRNLSKKNFDEKGVVAFALDLSDPNLNWVMQTGELEDNLETTIHSVETFYQRLGLSWRWVLNPSIDQENLKEALKKKGYVLTYSAPILVGSLQDRLPEDCLNDFDIKQVGEEKLSDWIIPLKEAYQATNENALLYQEAHLRALQKKANFRHFVGYVNDVPVAAATLSLSPYGARLDDLGILTTYQKKGFGTAMALFRMKIAKNLGYDWICLEASNDGARLYKKMGFKELYPLKIYRKK